MTLLNKITSNAYNISKGCYAIPPVFLLLFIIDSYTADLTEMLFLSLFLLSMFPFACVGLIFSIIGIRNWNEKGGYEYKDKGIWLIIIGIGMSLSGVMGTGLVYVMVM